MGLITGLSLLSAWTLTTAAAVLHGAPALRDLPWAVPLMLLLTWLSTGVFITAHEAMHGLLAPKHPRLNDAVGAVALRVYALFDFSTMRRAHMQHHQHPGQVALDPDFHDGEHRTYLRWYLHFFTTYTRWPQLLGMMLVFDTLAFIVGLPWQALLCFWVVPVLASTHQLFYFGTYLPHRNANPTDPHRARSVALPPWLSLLACFHFGYHREHHQSPSVPWWKLPSERFGGGADTPKRPLA